MHESGENYLETILMLQQRNGSVRSVDVATELGYTKASISRAVGILREQGYITIENGGEIIFTDLGRETAEAIYARHTSLTRFLELALGVSPETAASDACRIEHVISQETSEAVKRYVKEHESGAEE